MIDEFNCFGKGSAISHASALKYWGFKWSHLEPTVSQSSRQLSMFESFICADYFVLYIRQLVAFSDQTGATV
jgi:hypothetical protein